MSLDRARISHRVAAYIMKKSFSSPGYWSCSDGLLLHTVLGAPWLVFSASARTCSLEGSDRYALRSRARAEGKIRCAMITPPGEKCGLARTIHSYSLLSVKVQLLPFRFRVFPGSLIKPYFEVLRREMETLPAVAPAEMECQRKFHLRLGDRHHICGWWYPVPGK